MHWAAAHRFGRGRAAAHRSRQRRTARELATRIAHALGRRLHPPVGDPSVGADGAGDIVDDAQRSLESDTVSERYGRFLLEDILPFIQRFAPNITTDPCRRALMGVSSGCAPRHCSMWIHQAGPS